MIPRTLLTCALAALTFVGGGAAAAETIPVNGVNRTYTLVASPSGQRAPLVVALHGQGGNGPQLKRYSNWDRIVRSDGIVVAFPDAIGGNWQLTAEPNPDVTFLIALVNKLVADKIVDPKRVFITGVSRGGAMTYVLACERPEYFAAVAPIIVSVTKPMLKMCEDRAPMPVLLMNATADPRIPYNGGLFSGIGGTIPLVSTKALLTHWRSRNDCLATDWTTAQLPDLDTKDKSRVTRIGSKCPNERDVVLYRIDGGGHQQPSRPSTSPAPLTAQLGPQSHDIDGAETIWAFFKSRSR